MVRRPCLFSLAFFDSARGRRSAGFPSPPLPGRKFEISLVPFFIKKGTHSPLRSVKWYSCSFRGRFSTVMPSMRPQRQVRSIMGTSLSSCSGSPWASSVTLPSQLLATQPVRSSFWAAQVAKYRNPTPYTRPSNRQRRRTALMRRCPSRCSPWPGQPPAGPHPRHHGSGSPPPCRPRG